MRIVAIKYLDFGVKFKISDCEIVYMRGLYCGIKGYQCLNVKDKTQQIYIKPNAAVITH